MGPQVRHFVMEITIARPICAALVFSVLASLASASEGAKMTIDLSPLGQKGQHITFTQANEVKLLPKAVLDEFPSGIVDSKADFQVTDVVVGKLLPTRRFIVAGISEKYCLVHYERGGIAHSWLIALFILSKDKAKLVWVSMVPGGGKLSFSKLKAAVESGDLRDQPGHTYW
jgi:hypothetical protein